MKRWIALFLALILSLSLFACSKPAENDTAATDGDTTAETTDDTAATEDTGDTDAAETSGEKIQIGLTFLALDNPFFVSFKAAIEDACAANDVELVFSDSQGTSEGQIKALEDFISMGVDAIIITPQDAEAVSPLIAEARSNGIYVVCHTTKANEYDAYVGADEYEMGYCLGEAAGQWIKENLGDQETVQAATLNYDISPSVIPRKEGIIDGVNAIADNVEFVGTETAGETSAGMAAAETFLAAYPDLQVLLGINDGGVLGAYEAFMDAGKDGDDILLGGIDATDEGLAKVAEGGIFRITVNQDPTAMGQRCVQNCLDLIAGKEVEKDYYVELTAVTADNVADYIK